MRPRGSGDFCIHSLVPWQGQKGVKTVRHRDRVGLIDGTFWRWKGLRKQGWREGTSRHVGGRGMGSLRDGVGRLCGALPPLSFLGIRYPGFLRTVNVVRVHRCMIPFFNLCETFPALPFFCRDHLPLLADQLGQICLPLLHWRGGCTILDIFGAGKSSAILTPLLPEQHEGIPGTLDVILVSLSRVSLNGIIGGAGAIARHDMDLEAGGNRRRRK